MANKERPDPIGYVHPNDELVNNDYSSGGYAVVDDEGNRTVKADAYATYESAFGSDDPEIVTVNANVCPTCNSQAISVCNCLLKDKMCKNRHVWFLDNGRIVAKDPHDDDDLTLTGPTARPDGKKTIVRVKKNSDV